MTTAESSVSEPPNLKIFVERIPPRSPYKARGFGTRDNALGYKNLATDL